MNKRRCVRTLIALLALGLSWPVLAEGESYLVVGARVQSSSWSGDNGSGGGQDFEAEEGGQFGFNVTYRKGRFYTGMNFQGGEYEFSGGAPDRVGQNFVLSDNEATIKRGEFDWFFGYYFWDYVSLFLDIKSVTNDWQGNVDYALNYSGLGMGVTGFYPLNEDWTLYGSFGVVPLTIKADKEEFGDGTGSAIEFGAIYRMTPQWNLTMSIKNQHQEYDFDNGSEQTHDIGGLVLGVNYQFEL